MKKSDARIPEALVKALAHDAYDGKSDISASALGEPIKITVLKMRHNNSSVPPEENVFMTIGTAMHDWIDKFNSFHIPRMTVKLPSGVTISGKVDLFDELTSSLYDFKITSVYSAGKDVKEQYKLQLNCYKFLLKKTQGINVENLYIVNIYRDFSLSTLIRTFQKKGINGYPLTPVEVLDVEKMSEDEFLSILISKVNDVLKFKNVPDDYIPECNEEERWHAKEGYPLRCLAYCPVNKYCNYYNNEVKQEYGDIVDMLETRYYE